MRLLLPTAVGVLAMTSLVALAKVGADKTVEGHSAVVDASTPHDRLFSVVFDGDRGLAVGEAGLLKYSDDAGKTWTRQDAPTEQAMIDVATNGQRTIAVGQEGLILVRDGDGAWKQVESGTDRRLLQVDINKSGVAYIVGAFGTMLKSTDSGDTWKSIAPNWAGLYESGEGMLATVRDEPTNYIVDVRDNGHVIIGGEYGQLMFSPDGGICWYVVYRHPSEGGESAPTLFSMDIRADGVGYAVGQSGLVVRTDNNGMSWKVVPTPSTASLFAVALGTNGYVTTIGQRVGLRSADGGATWTPIDVLDVTLNWYSALARPASAPSGEVIAVGHSGRVLRLAP